MAAGPADIGPIMELEAKAFDPELQASRETVLTGSPSATTCSSPA